MNIPVVLVYNGFGRCPSCGMVYFYTWYADDSASCVYCGGPAVQAIVEAEVSPDDKVGMCREIDRRRSGQ